MITNDIASLIQSRDKVAIVLKEPYAMKGLKLDENEELALLTLFSSCIKEHNNTEEL